MVSASSFGRLADMEHFGLPSSSPVQAFSSSGQLAGQAVATSSRNVLTGSPSMGATASRRPLTSTKSASSASRPSLLLNALETMTTAKSMPKPADQLNTKTQAAKGKRAGLDSIDKAAAKAAREAESRRKQTQKAALMASKKEWIEANKLKRTKAETFPEMVIDVDGSMLAPAAPAAPTSTAAPAAESFAGVLHGSGADALRSRLTEQGATMNVVGSTEARGPGAVNPLSTALGITTRLPDLPVIRLRRIIKARLEVEHRIWVPLPAPTLQHEPTAIIVLSGAEVLAHLSQGPGSLSQMMPRVKASLASSGGVHQSQAFQLFLVIVGLQMHFRKMAQKSDQDFRRAVQTGLARREDPEVEVAASSSRRRKGTLEHTFANLDQEAAELDLLRLTMEHGVYVIHSKALVEAVETIVDIVGEVGIRPYKMVANSHLPFCADSIRTRSAGTEEATYLAILEQIPRVTPAIAKAIQGEYPSLRTLMEAYERARALDRRKNSVQAVDDMLADIKILHRKDGQASSRRIGQAVSKRIAFVLNQHDSLALV